jgi:hypothetical protein
MLEDEPVSPVHVIVAKDGYRSHPQSWPKPGMFCPACLTVVVNAREQG